MRRFFFGGILFTLAASLHAAMPELLEAALQKVSDEADRWAYTQTIVERNEKGKVVHETTVRFNPSKPFPEQYTALLVDGQTPTAAHQKKYRRQGERRGERIEKAESAGTTPTRKTLGELMDLENAVMLSSDGRTTTYEVPLRKEGNRRLPPEKFRVTARVSNALRAFEQIDVQLRAPMRTQVVLKIKSGEGRLEFTTVDSKYAPTLTAISGDAAGSVVLVPIGRSYVVKRAEFQRVKPFGDRFQVKMGPLKAIDF